MKIRISLVQMFLATAFVAVACFAMTHPTELVKSIAISTTVAVLLTIAARATVLGRKSSSRLRIALVLGIGYFGVVHYLYPSFVTSLLTTAGLNHLYSFYAPDPHSTGTSSSVVPAPTTSPVAPPSFGSSTPVLPFVPPIATSPYDDYYAQERFISIGQCVFTLLFVAAPYMVNVVARPTTSEKSGEDSRILK